ncbi:MAG: hypothetical protein M0P12_08410 [Paludibacteraceae bacterium]|jgi:hypothetical protein|nr:hypothetical protein [Paludibacteraceae bacterium]HOI26377.1 hypothetical protein [Paludibacteraceae bacterium]HOU68357.1 hypothetical protein [Paludibacteraceae bacterium]HPH63147.1 hypothetical protein [Paludibacteraceae bacterium]HQF50214.1 hypothetical protein [Paludibacteraceae bacterium]
MGLLEKLTKKKDALEEAVRERSEEYNSLIRVYMQAVMAANLGITDLRMLPDMLVFKRKLKIATQGRLGVAEKAYIRNLMMKEYGMKELFFNEIDSSAKKFCKKQNDIPNYFYAFQGLSQDLFMAVGTKMQYKLRLPSIFKGLIRSMIKKTIHEVLTKDVWKAADVRQACVNVRMYQQKLHLSEDWMFEYVYPVLMIAKGSKAK